MTAKQYLRQLTDLSLDIKTKEEEYEVASSQAMKMSKRLEDIKVQSSDGGKGHEDQIIKMIDISIKIARDVERLNKLREEAKEIIEQIEDGRYRAVLTLRYVCDLEWKEVAEKMSYDIRHATRLHGHALLEFERAMYKHVLECPSG